MQSFPCLVKMFAHDMRCSCSKKATVKCYAYLLFQLLMFSAQELLKYTSADHPDYPHVVAAQKAMKEVAMLINEQKRRIENMGKIGCWQKTIDGWKVC